MRPSFSQIIRMLETFLMTIPPPPSEPNEDEESEETRSSLSSRSSSGSSLVSRATSKLSVVRHLFASKKASNGKAWCVVPWDAFLWCCKGASLGHAWYKRDLVPCRVAVVLMIQRKVEAQLLQAMYIARSCFTVTCPFLSSSNLLFTAYLAPLVYLLMANHIQMSTDWMILRYKSIEHTSRFLPWKHMHKRL